MLKLAEALTRDLLQEPESGMGYQIVEAMMEDHRVRRAVAYNADLLLFEDEPRPMFKTSAYVRLLLEARSSEGSVKTLHVLPRSTTARVALAMNEDAARYGSGPARDATEEKTKFGEVFVRFSAYENDRRITASGALRRGSYATTAADAVNVQTGNQAVARYALPNPQPASFRFAIHPLRDTVVQKGIVEPAYGQPGGGIEVLFTKGTADRTVTGLPPIPDE